MRTLSSAMRQTAQALQGGRRRAAARLALLMAAHHSTDPTYCHLPCSALPYSAATRPSGAGPVPAAPHLFCSRRMSFRISICACSLFNSSATHMSRPSTCREEGAVGRSARRVSGTRAGRVTAVRPCSGE